MALRRFKRRQYHIRIGKPYCIHRVIIRQSFEIISGIFHEPLVEPTVIEQLRSSLFQNGIKDVQRFFSQSDVIMFHRDVIPSLAIKGKRETDNPVHLRIQSARFRIPCNELMLDIMHTQIVQCSDKDEFEVFIPVFIERRGANPMLITLMQSNLVICHNTLLHFVEWSLCLTRRDIPDTFNS